jgi:FkbM family methyltransferase
LSSLLGKLVDRYAPPLARLYRTARDLRAPALGADAATLPNGVRLRGESQDSVDHRMRSGEIPLFARALARCETLVDVGSNVGLFACLGAASGVHTIAIEPAPGNVRLLCHNVRANGLTGVEVIPLGVADRIGIEALYGSGQGASLIHGWGGIRANSESLIPVNTLDGLLGERLRGRRLLIKIDVEGAELSVLEGARGMLSAPASPELLVEIGFEENFDGRINPTYVETFEMLFGLGFDCLAVEAGERVDILAVRKWVERRKRDFYALNFFFGRPAVIEAEIESRTER